MSPSVACKPSVTADVKFHSRRRIQISVPCPALPHRPRRAQSQVEANAKPSSAPSGFPRQAAPRADGLWLTMSFGERSGAKRPLSCTKATWMQIAAPTRRGHPEGTVAQRRRCAWHRRWIGGESASRGALVATASRRQLRCREAVWGGSSRRTAAPNVSKSLCKPDRPGQRVSKRDAQNPTEAGAVVGAGAAGHPVFLPREVCVGPLL
jgi:hypothetical protein